MPEIFSLDKLGPLPEPDGFSVGTYDGALFTKSQRTAKNFEKGAGIEKTAWFTAYQMRAYAAQEVAALRRDAERYRWLRARIPGSTYRIMGVIYSEGGPGVDAAIDAAMKELK